jgi:hypothetical protein
MPKKLSKAESAAEQARKEVIDRQAPLLQAIADKMDERGHTGAHLAEALGMSASFVTAIQGGYRWVAKTNESSIKAIAKYLGVGTLQVYIWSGLFAAEDMVVSDDLPETMKNIYELMFKEPLIRHIVPSKSEFFAWPQSAQLRYVMLFEMIHNKRLLEHATVPVKKAVAKNLKFILDR